MRIFGKGLLVAVIAATAFYFGPRSRPAATRLPSPAADVPPPASPVATAATDPLPVIFQSVPPQNPSDPLKNSLVSIRSKLRQWQASQINDPDDVAGRARLLQAMLAMVTDENVTAIIQSLTPEELNTPFGTGALHHWMQVDPVSASNWLAARPDTTQNETLAVAGGWVGNPDGLSQYLAQLPDTAWKQTFLQDAGSEMAAKDPLAAIQLAQQMNPGDTRTNLLRSVVSGWVGTDPAAAIDWVGSVPDPSLREQLVASVVQSYALADPAQAADWLVQEVKSEAVLNDAALNILGTWVASDPAAAADWASRFPEGNLKAAAVTIVSSHWRQTDPAAAMAWIQNLSGEVASPAN